eukprot:gene3550-4562_t
MQRAIVTSRACPRMLAWSAGQSSNRRLITNDSGPTQACCIFELGRKSVSRYLSFAYGVVCYSLFFAVFLYLIGFLNDVVVPKSVSSGEPGPMAPALLVDLGLIALFGIQHSVMARPGFKRWLTQFVPQVVERSSYVLATNIVLILTYLYWQPLPGVIWQIDNATLVMA